MPPRRKTGEPVATKKKPDKELHWAVKKPDSEPITRVDLQWQLLEDIFSDRTFRFTAPVDRTAPAVTPANLNFDQLYLEAILSSTKISFNLKTKLIENPTFAMNFCKVCLLINIGRFNTTLAFYPNMKTALRTYHPIAALQPDETSRNDMQDSPRIKAILKGCVLDWEEAKQPATLRDIAVQASKPYLVGPPTTIVSTLFCLFNEAPFAAIKYFPAGSGHDVRDLFYPSFIPSAPRAHAFLSLVHHILENKTFPGDFADSVTPHSPCFISLLTETPSLHENIDTEEEIAFAVKMKHDRIDITKDVHAYHKREENANAREAKQTAKDLAKESAVDTGSPTAPKKRGGRPKGSRPFSSSSSYAKTARLSRVAQNAASFEILPAGWRNQDWNHPDPARSTLPSTWNQIKHDLLNNVDPDYDSDTELPWPHDLLVRRALLTVTDSAAQARVPPTFLKDDWNEWKRIQAGGVVLEDAKEEEGAEEMEVDED